MKITDGNIVICPLESITQFYQEGKAMHHCVYKLGYYNRPDSLILSAKGTGETYRDDRGELEDAEYRPVPGRLQWRKRVS